MPDPTVDAPRHPALQILEPPPPLTVRDELSCAIAGTAEDADDITGVTWRNVCGTHQESTGSAVLTAVSAGRKTWAAAAVPLLRGVNCIIVTATSGNTATAWAATMVIRPPATQQQ